MKVAHCNSGGGSENDSTGEDNPLVSESDRTVGSRPEFDRQRESARIHTQHPPLYSPHHAPYAPGPGAPGRRRSSMQALHQFPRAVSAHAQAQQYPAHAQSQQYPAHAQAQQYPVAPSAGGPPLHHSYQATLPHAHAQQYPAHAHAHQYTDHAHQHPGAPSAGVHPLHSSTLHQAQTISHQYPAAPQKGVHSYRFDQSESVRAQSTTSTSTDPTGFPKVIGRPMPPEISAAYEILARARQNPLSVPRETPTRPGWPQPTMPPGTQPVDPMLSNYDHPYHHHHHLVPPPVYHIQTPAPALISTPHAFPTDSRFAEFGPFTLSSFARLKNIPGKSAPSGPSLDPSYPGMAAPSPRLVSHTQEDEVSDENSTISSLGRGGGGENKPKKMLRRRAKAIDPVYAQLHKETMIGLMEKYGPVVWYSFAKDPYLVARKERTLFALRQIFRRWNPDFSIDFHYITETDSWEPVRGEQAEIERRVELRRLCHAERVRVHRFKMYEKWCSKNKGQEQKFYTYESRKLTPSDRAAAAKLKENAAAKRMQKEFHKSNKEMEPPKRGRWTLEEDAALTKAVQKFGRDWTAVASLVHGRERSQCSQRWLKNVDPEVVFSSNRAYEAS